MQLNKKIIYTTILLAFAILFFCNSNVFAVQTGQLNYEGTTYTYSIPDEAVSFIIAPTTYYSDENILLYSTEQNIEFRIHSGNRVTSYLNNVSVPHYQIPLRISKGEFNFHTGLSGYKQVPAGRL